MYIKSKLNLPDEPGTSASREEPGRFQRFVCEHNRAGDNAERGDFAQWGNWCKEIATTVWKSRKVSYYGAASPLFTIIVPSLLHSVQEGLERLHRNQRKGIRHRLKEFTKSSSLRAEIEGYRYRLHDLRTNFTVCKSSDPSQILTNIQLIAAMNTDLNVSKLSSLVQLNVEGFAFGSNSQSTGLPIPTGCPPPSRIFHGRRTILDKMHQYFSQDIGRRHICLLHGLGGSGKTQIAFKFLDETDSSR